MLAGQETPDAGTVTLRRGAVVAFLPQLVTGDERTVRQWIADARPEHAARAARARRRRAARSPNRRWPRTSSAWGGCSSARRRSSPSWRAEDVEGEGLRILRDLGLPDAILDAETRRLSGGQAKLVALTACLVRRPDVLLLDEPEAHLDVSRRTRLEELLRSEPGAVLMVSHDRYLLDETVTAIAELDGGRIRLWPGDVLGLCGRARARARPPAPAVRHAAEGDRAPRGHDPALQGLGAPHRGQALHHPRAQQAAPDRPHGQGRPAGVRAPQDGPRAAQRGCAAASACRAARPRVRPGADRGRPDRHARRARRRDRPQRRRQDRARAPARRRARSDLRRALGRPDDRVRPPDADRRRAARRPHGARRRARGAADDRGDRGPPPDAASCSTTSRSAGRSRR